MCRFWIAAVCAAIPMAFLTIFIVLNSENSRIDAARDAGQAISALAAFATCGWLAWRSTGGRRWAWGLLALSGLAALVVEVVEAMYTLSSNTNTRYLSASDVGIAAALPLAIAGLLFFPRAARRFAMGRRTA